MINQTNPKRNEHFAYILGVLTTAIIVSILWHANNKGHLLPKVTALKTTTSKTEESVIELPDDVLQELIQVKAVVENADNPTYRQLHHTILVEPHDTLLFALKPNRTILGYMLKTLKPFNLDPPVLYTKKGIPLSENVKDYIHNQTRVAYSYTVNEEGLRVTLPIHQSEKKLLIVGDSVAFGEGVDDDATIASHLQNLLQDKYQVINAGVGGYGGENVYRMAKMMGAKQKFHGLIYIASQNDFMFDDWGKEAEKILKKMKTLEKNFDGNIVVVLHTYMEYTMHDIILNRQWSESRVKRTDQLRQSLLKTTQRLNMKFLDWSDLLQQYRNEKKSIFSGFALYADHCHLSSAGNKLLAENLIKSVLGRERSNVGAVPRSSDE